MAPRERDASRCQGRDVYRGFGDEAFDDLLREIRGIRRHDLSECRGCGRLSFCGRCHAQAMVEDGDLYGPSSYARARADLLEAAAGRAPGS